MNCTEHRREKKSQPLNIWQHFHLEPNDPLSWLISMHWNVEWVPLPTRTARNMAGLCHLFPVLFLVLEQVRERKSEEAMYMHIDYMDLYLRGLVLWHSPTLIQVSLGKTLCAPALSLVSHQPRTLLASDLTWTLCTLQYHEWTLVHSCLCVPLRATLNSFN